MTADQLAREAGARLRREVAAETHPADIEASLRALHATVARRGRRHTIARGLAVAAAIVGVAGGAAVLSSREENTPRPAAPAPGTCSTSELVTCTDDGRITVDAGFTYSFRLTKEYDAELEPLALLPYSLELSSSARDAGVSFYVDPEAAEPGVESDAEALATWVASRPFLRTDINEHSLSGYRSWRVDVALRPGKALSHARSCNGEGTGSPCRALLDTGGNRYYETGPWSGEDVSYLFVDAPKGHTLLVVSWTLEGPEALDANDRLISSLRLGEG